MKFNTLNLLICSAVILSVNACKKDKDKPEEAVIINSMPAFYKEGVEENYGKTNPALTMILDRNDEVFDPWDIDFHPTRANELWVLNKGIDATGSSTVTVKNAGLPGQEALYRKDQNSWHFMALASSLSFSRENGNWANGAEIQDANRQGGTFTGPSLWSSDMSVYAQPSGGNGSHLDMLHGSPYSMGIEADKDNAFWVFDGYYGHIVWYDFAADHGPGNADHSDGRIHRYTDISVEREPGIPSHMVLDQSSGWLYIADPANSRILRMNTNSGTKKRDMPIINEPLAEHWEMENVSWNVFINYNLQKPAGIEISNGVLYVSDYQTGEIIAYNMETQKELGRISTGKSKVMGIKANTDGKLWFVANGSNEIYRIDPI